MKRLKDDLTLNKKIIEYLKKRRNKSFAHNDKKMSFDTKLKYHNETITYQEIDDFIDLLIKDVNEISYCLFGKQYAFVHSELDEITYICNIFKEHKNNV